LYSDTYLCETIHPPPSSCHRYTPIETAILATNDLLIPIMSGSNSVASSASASASTVPSVPAVPTVPIVDNWRYRRDPALHRKEYLLFGRVRNSQGGERLVASKVRKHGYSQRHNLFYAETEEGRFYLGAQIKSVRCCSKPDGRTQCVHRIAHSSFTHCTMHSRALSRTHLRKLKPAAVARRA
jgi:phosphoribosylformylglycinamidine (FGAM) synthase-like enzyme